MPTKSAALFRAKVQQALEHYKVEEVANYLGVSLPTVELWSQGKNLPYVVARAYVMDAIKVLLDSK